MTTKTTNKILVTSFDTWKAHHVSNASDDLLALALKQGLPTDRFYLLRKIPVDFQLAPSQVLAAIAEIQPHTVICCGMAEKRSQLSLESTGTKLDALTGQPLEKITTKVNLDKLVDDLTITQVSHSAGKFVCNALYHSVLSHLRDRSPATNCIFLHVPVLTSTNSGAIVADFMAILQTFL
jgi:pyroglutamyl-peptidase